MQLTANLAVCLLFAVSVGCESSVSDSEPSTPSGVVLGAPWHDTEGVGSVSSLLGSPLKITSSKGNLFTILETVANHYSVTITVEPAFLLDKPITVDLEGDSAENVLNELAKKAGFEITKLADNKWQFVYASLRDGKAETVKQSDY